MTKDKVTKDKVTKDKVTEEKMTEEDVTEMPEMNGPLDGQMAMVMGASGGMGLLAARALAQTGCGVYLSGVNFMNLDTAARSLKDSFSVDIEIHTGNPANAVDAEAIAMSCADADILINCTGNLVKGSLDDIPEDVWRRSWEAAVFGVINITREMLGHMNDAQRGLVILVIDSPATPDGDDICATAAGGALKAFVKAQGKSTPKGVKIIGLMTHRTVEANAFSSAISKMVCDPELYATGSLISIEDVNT